MDPALADRIDAVLPQTQCTKCGFDGCRPYAEAIAAGAADINRCPPGGAAGIVKLSHVTARPIRPLDPAHGVETPRAVAVVDEALCIGCTLCIQACPVDAIVGAPRVMHTVVAEWCNGCDLCVAPCPMDCIVMRPVSPPRAWTEHDADTSRARHTARGVRLAAELQQRTAAQIAKAERKLAALQVDGDADAARKRAVVQAAIERARARRQARA